MVAEETGSGLGFDPEIRLGFIRKVYGIVAAQLTVTATFVAFFMKFAALHIIYKEIKDPNTGDMIKVGEVQGTGPLFSFLHHPAV